MWSLGDSRDSLKEAGFQPQEQHMLGSGGQRALHPALTPLFLSTSALGPRACWSREA